MEAFARGFSGDGRPGRAFGGDPAANCPGWTLVAGGYIYNIMLYIYIHTYYGYLWIYMDIHYILYMVIKVYIWLNISRNWMVRYWNYDNLKTEDVETLHSCSFRLHGNDEGRPPGLSLDASSTFFLGPHHFGGLSASFQRIAWSNLFQESRKASAFMKRAMVSAQDVPNQSNDHCSEIETPWLTLLVKTFAASFCGWLFLAVDCRKKKSLGQACETWKFRRHATFWPRTESASKPGWWFGTSIFIFPINIGNLIIPIDELIFFRGVAQPPTRNKEPIFWKSYCSNVDPFRR